MIFGRRKLVVPGARTVDRRAVGGCVNWPRCARCRRIVDAYGLANETERSIEIWARCSGQLVDPSTGLPLVGRAHEPMAGSVVVRKGPSWSEQRLMDILVRQQFFAEDGGDRELVQTLTASGVDRRWGAG